MCAFPGCFGSWPRTENIQVVKFFLALYCLNCTKFGQLIFTKIIKIMGHMNIGGPQLFYSFLIRWMKVVHIGALFVDWRVVLRSFRFQ